MTGKITMMASQKKFPDAEHMWFWFISSRRIKNGFSRSAENDARPCELVDVETLVTQMYLAGRISAAELEVMKKYGELRRAPNQYLWRENRDAAMWASAMRALESAGCGKGWIG